MKKPSAKKTLLILAPCSLVLLAGLYWTSDSARKSHSPAASSLQSSEVLSSVQGQIINKKAIGSKSRTQLDLKSRGSFRFGADQKSQKALIDQKIESAFQGELEEIVFADDGVQSKSYLIPGQATLQLILNGQEQKDMAQKILADLSGGFVLHRDRSGLVLDVIMPEGAADFSADFAYSIAKSIQYAFPEGELKREWSSQEEDGNGHYQARYTVEGQDSDLLKVRRDRVLYHKLSASIEGSLGGNTLSSKTHGELRLEYDMDQQIIRSVSGMESLATLDDNHQPLGLSETTIAWDLKELSTLDADHLSAILDMTKAKFADRASYASLRDEASERQTRSMYENRLGKDNLETILNTLQGIDAMTDEDASTKLQTEWFLKARALVYLHPEELPRILDLLRSAKVEGAWFQIMTSALLNISSPEAQKVLSDLALDRRGEPKAMESLIPDLGFVQSPGPVVEETLRTLQQDESTRNMADLALATMGSQLAKDSSAEAQDRMSMLIKDVHAGMETTDKEILKHKLDMLGNLSSEESLPLLKSSLKNEDPELRALSAFALRDLKSAEAEQALRSVLLDEKDVEVRVNAATALQNYKAHADLLKFQTDAIEREPNERVRIQLLIAIAKAKYLDQAAVKQALEARSRLDSHEQVRNYADLLLTEFASH